MTIARTLAGDVLGQVLDRTPDETLERDPKAVPTLLILSASGYSTVPASSVRLEEV